MRSFQCCVHLLLRAISSHWPHLSPCRQLTSSFLSRSLSSCRVQNRPQGFSTIISGWEPRRQGKQLLLRTFTTSLGDPPFSVVKRVISCDPDAAYVVKELIMGNSYRTVTSSLWSPDLCLTLCPTSQPRVLQQWLNGLDHIWLTFLAFVECFVFLLSSGKTRLEFFKGILLMCWLFIFTYR